MIIWYFVPEGDVTGNTETSPIMCVQYHSRLFWVPWRMFSTREDITIHVGYIISTMGTAQSPHFSCSVPWGDIIIHVWGCSVPHIYPLWHSHGSENPQGTEHTLYRSRNPLYSVSLKAWNSRNILSFLIFPEDNTNIRRIEWKYLYSYPFSHILSVVSKSKYLFETVKLKANDLSAKQI